MHKVLVHDETGVAPCGGMHDTVVLVLSGSGSKLLDKGEWPHSHLPRIERINEMLQYAFRLRRLLLAHLSVKQYYRLLGSGFNPLSVFGEVVVLTTKLFMLEKVSVYHLVDNAIDFIDAYCGVPNAARNLSYYLDQTYEYRLQVMTPHSWMLGTVSQFLGTVKTNMLFADVIPFYNKLARNTVPVLTGLYLDAVLDDCIVSKSDFNINEFKMRNREIYVEYLIRVHGMLLVMRDTCGLLEHEQTIIIRCINMIVACGVVTKCGVERYNRNWFQQRWEFGKLESLPQLPYDLKQLNCY
jgi:hypothetical protein